MGFPVIRAFSATFAYLMRHGADLLKALWLPVGLIVALQLYVMPSFFSSLSSIIALGENPEPSEAASALGDLAKWGLVLTAGSAIAYPMITVASLRHVVRGDELKAPFYLRYGGDELRVLAAYILISIMVILISVVGGLGATIVVMVLTLVAPQARQLLSVIGEFAVNLVSVWFRVRLATLYPASLATGTIGFGAAWASTKGSAWSLFFFFVLVGLALLPFAVLVTAPFAGEFFPLFRRLAEAGQDTLAAREALIPMLDAFGKLYSPENPSFALFVPLLFVSTLVSSAVLNVASGIAWRFLTDGGPGRQAAAQSIAA